MSLIQFLLVLGAFGALTVYLSFFRSVFKDRALAVVIFVSATLATLFPDATTSLAQFLGVGRGTDLIFYLFAVGSVFIGILFYSKLARLEQNLTKLSREIAIIEAKRPS